MRKIFKNSLSSIFSSLVYKKKNKHLLGKSNVRSKICSEGENTSKRLRLYIYICIYKYFLNPLVAENFQKFVIIRSLSNFSSFSLLEFKIKKTNTY